MELKLSNNCICRTPAISFQDDLATKWGKLQNLIKDASPSFYQAIEHLTNPDSKEIDEKIRFTIWKYFNRAKYRATPYGGFAAISLLPTSNNGKTSLKLSHDILFHQFTDWKETGFIDNKSRFKNSDLFQTNSSIYTIGQEHRYIRLRDGIFEITSVIGFPQLNAMLNLCREKTPKWKIYRMMADEFQLQTKQTRNLLLQMLSLQLLLGEHFPNITGEDYFSRQKIKNSKPTSPYIISERKLISGGLDHQKLKGIPDMIEFLSACLPNPIYGMLDKFRSAFIKKFEHKLVPLAFTMDPETGIGYDNLFNNNSGEALLDILNSSHNEPNDLQIRYSEFHQFLLKGIMNRGTIRLEEFKGKKKQTKLPLPNTFSIMLRFWEGRPVIESIGGCTANALLGRFTIVSRELEKVGHELATIEEQANPDILFFDIAYHAEKDVDNVNRRKCLYKHEAPILTWSCDLSPINFDDILVGVKGNEIILWSKKYSKRMVPRIPSAYNYTRSDLSIFRFLCDLQHQSIQSDLNFKIQSFFPGLQHYPRVVYKNIILSPAKWQVPPELLSLNKSGSSLIGKTNLTNWLHNENIDFKFKIGHADQTLCFDPENMADLESFFLYCRQNCHKEIYLSEALISKEDGVSDEKNKQYAAEFIVNYYHRNPIYEKYEYLGDSKRIRNNDIVLPGGQWLYFEIYCHPSRSNRLLLNQISSFLRENRDNIREWFFIRYDDPRPHIRLRLLLKERSQGYLTISALKSLLDEETMTGLISDIQIKTYFRETERYGVNRIELVEKLFNIDSHEVLQLLSKEKTTDQLYVITIKMMQRVLESSLGNIDKQILFVKSIATNFADELKLNQENFKKINRYFKEIKNVLETEVEQLTRYEKTFKEIINKCHNDSERIKIIADLLHMHINRLFYSNQRLHEAILYHCLLQLLSFRRALLIAPTELPNEP